jgi:hypothetical protein
MAASSINTSSFQVEDSGGSPITGIVSYDAATRQAIFRATPPFQNLASFTASISTAVTDYVGNHLAAGRSWSFSIRGPGASLLYVRHGGGDSALFGSAVAGVGDVNKDGYDDFIVGAGHATDIENVWAQAGRMVVYSGASGDVLYHDGGTIAGANLGMDVNAAGDVDGDGYADFIVGVPGGPNAAVTEAPGQAIVYLGVDGSEWFTAYGENQDDEMGTRTVGVGDINGDGFDDVAVAAPYYIGGLGSGTDVGKVYIYSGVDGTLLASVEGEANDLSTYFGAGLTGPGDLNGDGVPDLIVGAPASSAEGASKGRVFIYSGADLSQLYGPLNGENAGDYFGATVKTIGDINGDGVNDFIVGSAFTVSPPTFIGAEKAYVYSGANGSLITSLAGESVGDGFSFGVAGIGDVNGDGVVDFMVGAPAANSLDGKVYVYSGADRGLLYSFAGETGATTAFGVFMNGAGDVNGDGKPDFIVGAPWASVGGHTMVGSAFVYISH